MKLVKKDKKEIIWVLIYTKVKQEIKASENLRKQGFKTFLPLIAPSNKNTEFNEGVVQVVQIANFRLTELGNRFF